MKKKQNSVEVLILVFKRLQLCAWLQSQISHIDHVKWTMERFIPFGSVSHQIPEPRLHHQHETCIAGGSVFVRLVWGKEVLVLKCRCHDKKR